MERDSLSLSLSFVLETGERESGETKRPERKQWKNLPKARFAFESKGKLFHKDTHRHVPLPQVTTVHRTGLLPSLGIPLRLRVVPE